MNQKILATEISLSGNELIAVIFKFLETFSLKKMSNLFLYFKNLQENQGKILEGFHVSFK